MDTMINTPLLDAALETKALKYAPRFDRWVNAKADLVEGLAKKHIWNVDFVAAKERISSGVDAVMHMIFDESLEEFWRVRDMNVSETKDWEYQQRVFKAHEDYSTSCQLNQAAGRIKRLSKVSDVKGVKDYIEVLKEVVLLHEAAQALKPFIEKGRKPAENPTPVDITNTAHCAICGHRQKMNAAQGMVHHGFRITYMGQPLHQRMGSCFGVGYKPSELSCEANVAYIPFLEQQKTKTLELIAELRADKFDNHVEKRTKREGFRMVEYVVNHKRGTSEYAKLRDNLISRAEWEVKGYEQNIEHHQEIVKNWKPKAFDWKVA